jgi:5'-nucleotidase
VTALLLAFAGLTATGVCHAEVNATAVPWPPPATRVQWHASAAHGPTLSLRLLAFNDFHGNMRRPALSGRPAGGAGVLAAYLEAAQRSAPGPTLIIHAGDQIGASPPISRLLQNEPAMTFLNLLANEDCHYGAALVFTNARDWRRDPNRCNIVGTLGNHEFDAGPAELLRLLRGGNAAAGPFIEDPWRGSRVPYVCANVKDRRTGELILPPYTVVVMSDVPVGVIGAVVRQTPSLIPAWAGENLEFLDEVTAINAAATELKEAGIHTLIVAIHQGMVPIAAAQGWEWQGPLKNIIAQLDPDIDVVISGHTHNFTATLLPNRGARPVLVTQAYSYGVAYAQIDLQIDRATDAVVAKSARIEATWADTGPGLHPDAAVERLSDAAERSIAPRVARVIAHAPAAVTRAPSSAGESALGDLVADAQRAAVQADIALMNPGGLRSDIAPGAVTWGDILTVHPFGNRVLALKMSGAQLLAVLEQQWPQEAGALPKVLKTSGLYYEWDPHRPAGQRIVAACDNEARPLEPARLYRVAVNDFLAAGGDGFTALKSAPVDTVGPLDSEALAQYLGDRPQALAASIEGRIALASPALSRARCTASSSP